MSIKFIERSSTHAIDYKRILKIFRLQFGDQFVYFLNVVRYFLCKVFNSIAVQSIVS